MIFVGNGKIQGHLVADFLALLCEKLDLNPVAQSELHETRLGQGLGTFSQRSGDVDDARFWAASRLSRGIGDVVTREPATPEGKDTLGISSPRRRRALVTRTMVRLSKLTKRKSWSVTCELGGRKTQIRQFHDNSGFERRTICN